MAIITNYLLFNHTYLRKLQADGSVDERASFVAQGVRDWYGFRDNASIESLVSSWVQPVLNSLELDLRPLGQGNDHVHLLYRVSDWSEPVGLCYIAPSGTDLDTTTKGRHWMAQAVLAARRWEPAAEGSGQEEAEDGESQALRWVILTNGHQWRLLDAQALRRYEAYLQVDLEELVRDPGDLSALRVFYHCFHRSAFERDAGGRSGLDRLLDESNHATKKAEDHLKACVSANEGVMARLCLGLVEATGQDHFTAEERDAIFQDATFLLYRLLFVLYAEARGLLPMDNPAYQQASLNSLVETAHTYKLQGIPDPQATTLWLRLKRLCNAIYESDPELGIPAYNGGLFDDGDKPHLCEGAIVDGHLTQALFDLAYQPDGDVEDGYRRIDFRDLSVRHLGSIYEGMIEYRLQIAEETLWARRDAKDNVRFLKTSQDGAPRRNDVEIKKGDVYFSQSPGERRATGTYYTPEFIVDYIVQQTVWRGLEERCASQEEKLAGWLEEVATAIDIDERIRMQRTVDEELLRFVEDRILAFRVCDPAMGSGHFLVNACHQITNFVVETLHLLPWTNESVEADPLAWRRRIVARSLYGVDLSLMAVELAKLSLWLASVADGKPLSFLDHHLRQGNSLIGARLEDLAQVLGRTPPGPSRRESRARQAGQLSMLDDPAFSQHLTVATDLLASISARLADKLEDVKAQEADYEQVRSELEPYRLLADLWTARHFGVASDDQQLRSIAASLEGKTVDAIPAFRRLLAETAKLARSVHFFSWDLEFPHIFLAEADDLNHRPGFDAVVGNPPWMSFSGRERQALGSGEREYYSVYYLCSSGWLATHTLFGERALALLSSQGRHAFIVPDQVGYLDNYKSFRSILSASAPSLLALVRYTGEQVFPGVTSPTLVYVASRQLAQKVRIIDKQGRQQVVDAVEISCDPGLRWTFAPRAAIWKKVREHSVTLGAEFGDPGIHTGNCAGNLILKEPEGHCVPALEGSDVERYNVPEPRVWVRLDYVPQPDEYFTIRDLTVYQRARLLVRQTAAYPIATIHTGLPFRNSLLACFGHAVYADCYLLTLINSRLIREFYRDQFVESQQQVFPQVKVGYLRQIPVRRIAFTTPPPVREAHVDEAVALYEDSAHDRLLEFVEDRLTAEPEQSDVVHDLLVNMAEKMIKLSRLRQQLRGKADLFHFLDQDVPCLAFNKALGGPLGIGETVTDLSAVRHDIDALRLGHEADGRWLLEVRAKLRERSSGWREYQRDEDGNSFREWLPAFRLSLDDAIGRFYHYAFANLDGFDGAGRFPGGSTRTTLEKLKATQVPKFVPADLEPLAAREAELAEVRRKIQLTDDLIDQIVYKLYGLTEEEIAIVEGQA